MKMHGLDKHRDDVLQRLMAAEIDDAVIEGLLGIENAREILYAVADGSVKANIYQRKNALFVLGQLREPEAIPHLLAVLDRDDASLRVRALSALSLLPPDQRVEKFLKQAVRNEKAAPVEIAYALQALERVADAGLVKELKDSPAWRIRDSGVIESLAHLRARARVRKVPCPR